MTTTTLTSKAILRQWVFTSLTLGCALLSPACGARQWEVVFTTNALLPKMGDRLHVEILDESGQPACDDCVRDFLDESSVLQRKTIGVAQTKGVVRVRARLYRYVASTQSSAIRSIDVVARLPELSGSSAAMEVSFPIPIECFGLPPNIARATTCQYDAAKGVAIEGPEPTLSSPTTLPELTSKPDDGPCTKDVPKGMTCVGSGTFLLGDEKIESVAFQYPARPEVVQRIKPGAALMLDTDEMTVGTIRSLVKQGLLDVRAGSSALLVHAAPGEFDEACTFRGPDDASADALPINCIGRDLARSACAALKKRLPSESEWEFAAGNGVAESLYPWGGGLSDESVTYDVAIVVGTERVGICDFAIIGQGRDPATGKVSTAGDESTRCKIGKAWGPVKSGSPKDMTSSGLRNMGGNVAEWVDDELSLYDEECFSQPLAGTCRTPSKRFSIDAGQPPAPYRGGSWASEPHASLAVARFAQARGAASPYVGFRCAITEDALP